MPPASWTNANRTSVQLIVIHTTEGSEGPTSAEDGASYDQRRTDGTSTHFFHDSNTTVQCVRTEDIAHAARHQGNLRGIQHELCGSAYQGAGGWADAVSQGTLRQAAKQCARDAKKWGIPVRHLTVTQVAAGAKGFCGHVDVTYAFPQDNGDHTDPGPSFPWSQFLDMVRAEMGDDMPLSDTDMDGVADRVMDKLTASMLTPDDGYGFQARRIPWAYPITATRSTLSTLEASYALLQQVLGKVTADDAEAQRIIDAVHADAASLQSAVADVDEQVWAKIPDPSISAAEKADLLRAVLGDDAVAVGALLAQPA
jgi:hypothetical protein